MTLQEKAREWAEKEWQFFWLPETLPELKEATQRAYLAGAAGAMEWIPVSERLPEKEQRVLAMEADGYIEICNYSRFRNDKKYSFCDEQDEQPSTLTATHWMPLPPHPEKESI